jgi:hydroxymethylpyrimidine/phosphomethylpyrimidine kinase
MKIALTVAGSDSGGGAGIQADLKTFHQYGVFGTSVVVAVTAQNTVAVRAIHRVPASVVGRQLQSLAEDLPPAALKTGMLGGAAIVRRVARAIEQYRWTSFVCDPVMVATSGKRLLSRGGESALRDHLLPLAALVTPNLEEAALLTGIPVGDLATMERAGERLVALGARAALVKGGHSSGDLITDLLVTPQGTERYTHPRLRTTSTHGTGCTLSAAIAAGLALGRELGTAVADGIDFVHRAIREAPGLGRGHGPINHAVPAPLG